MTKVVFFGNERLATGVSTDAPTLRALIDGGYDVVAVVSHHSRSRSRSERELEIAAVAREHGIPLLLPEKPAEILHELAALQADIAVLAAYGKIVPQSVIDIFPHGIVNIHPSLLPLHRGPIPIESVIIDGSTETGVSIMQLVRAMDAGPVYGQTTVQLSGTETKQELVDRLLRAGGELLLQLLPDILSGSLQPEAQDESGATYDALITKADGVLDYAKPAARLEREVRAYAEWPKSRTTIGDKEVVVTAAHAASADELAPDPDADVTETSESVAEPANTAGKLWRNGISFGFYTSDGVFVIDSLKPAGKQEMNAAGFIAGYGSLLLA